MSEVCPNCLLEECKCEEYEGEADHLTTRQEMVDQGWNLDVELPDDEEDFLTGVTCNPDAPEECESCQ